MKFKSVIEYPVPRYSENRNNRESTQTVGQVFPCNGATEKSPCAVIRSVPLKLFYSYAHEDEEYRRRLDSHLSLLQRQGFIHAWHDRRIGAGTEWKEQIDAQLRAADIVLLLVSADFLGSDYCFDVELKWALDRHVTGELAVIPVIVRPVDWARAPFASLQALPAEGRAISSWSNQDEAFTNVARGIREIIDRRSSRKAEEASSTALQAGESSEPALSRNFGTETADEAVPDSAPLDRKRRQLQRIRSRRWRATGVLLFLLASLAVGYSLRAHVSDWSFRLSDGSSVENALERGKFLYRDKKYAAASETFQSAAENGSIEAADYLGLIHEYGLGTKPDCRAAMKWFQRAAKGNSSSGMDHLGLLFEHGCGTKVDNAKAKSWFERAANLGNADAMNNIGWMYANNLGVETNYNKAMQYFRKAAEYYDGNAMNNIGWLYQNGWGVPKPDPREAMRWFRKAAEAKSTLGMNSVGWIYENGFGLPNADYHQAMHWFRRAADSGSGLGSNWAMNNIGDMYEKGYLGAPNREEAVRWYRKSADNGFQLAKSNLERLGIKAPEDKPCCLEARSG